MATESWEALIIHIGHEIEMKSKQDDYPIDYEDLLDSVHKLEHEIRQIRIKR